MISHETQLVRGVYPSMELIGWFAIVPLSLAGLFTGLVQSLGTRWGLFRYWWVLVKCLLTTGAIVILLRHMNAVSSMSRLAVDTTLAGNDFRALRIQVVVHAIGALVVLLAATALSVYKPWGMTSYGRRQALTSDLRGRSVFNDEAAAEPHRRFVPRRPRWVSIVGIHAIGLVVLFIVFHIANGGLHGH